MTLTPQDLAALETLRWGYEPRAAYRRKEIARRLFRGKPQETPLVVYTYQVEMHELAVLRRQIEERRSYGTLPLAAATARVRAIETKFSHPLLARIFGHP